MGFLYFVLKCVHVLAWPSFALGYPLCASIHAIETNSNYHMRKLITYWILFSLISLFELAFAKLIEWVPIWPYIKLVVICSLVLPRFKGAYYAYKSFVHPCLTPNLEEAIKKLSKPQETTILKTENFLCVAERYVKENGTEALEKLIATKDSIPITDVEETKAIANAEEKVLAPAMQKHPAAPRQFRIRLKKRVKAVGLAKTNTASAANFCWGSIPKADAEEIKAIANAEENVLAPATQKHPAVPHRFRIRLKKRARAVGLTKTNTASAANFCWGSIPKADAEEIKAIANAEENVLAPAMQSKCKDPNFAQKDIKTVGPTKTNTASAANWVKSADVYLVQTENKAINATLEDKKMTISPPAGGEKAKALPMEAPLQKVQKEWTCAVCQVRTSSEGNLKDHLRGMRHRATVLQLKAIRQTTKNKVSSSSSASDKSVQVLNCDLKKYKLGEGVSVNQSKTQKEEKNIQVKVNNKNWCAICNVFCSCEDYMMSHLSGRKHLSRVQEPTAYPVCL